MYCQATQTGNQAFLQHTVKGEEGQAGTPDLLPRDVTSHFLNQIILRRHNIELSSMGANVINAN
jgi:hypothetical protein